MADELCCLGVAEVAKASDTTQGGSGAEAAVVCGENCFVNSKTILDRWVGEKLESRETGPGKSCDG